MKEPKIKNTMDVINPREDEPTIRQWDHEHFELQEIKVAVAHGRWTSLITDEELNDFAYVLSGTGKFTLDDDELIIKEGEVKRLRKNKNYRVEPVGKKDLVFLHYHKY